MRKKFDYYLGIDISKLTLDICILRECVNDTKTEHYKIENKEKSIAQFVKKKLANCLPEQILFCFEDTGMYSFPLACYLNDNNLIYSQVPAIEIKRSKGISRGKDDKTDAKDIAFYAFSNTHKLRQSTMPTTEIQKLKLLFTQREKVLKSLANFEKTSENEEFTSKEVFDTVDSINNSIVNHLKKNLTKIESKMLKIITSHEQLQQQYKLISRELKRNATPKGKYYFECAQDTAEIRKERMKIPRKLPSNFKKEIVKLIEMHWSPQQIEGRLKLENKSSISHGTIYKIIRKDKADGGDLYKHLRHKLKHRKRPVSKKISIKNRVTIDQRPEIVKTKERFGDWEIDTIVGKNNIGAILSLTERKTNFMII